MFNKTPEFSFSIITLKKEIIVCTGKYPTGRRPCKTKCKSVLKSTRVLRAPYPSDFFVFSQIYRVYVHC